MDGVRENVPSAWTGNGVTDNPPDLRIRISEPRDAISEISQKAFTGMVLPLKAGKPFVVDFVEDDRLDLSKRS
jgi:hypothetical protein